MTGAMRKGRRSSLLRVLLLIALLLFSGVGLRKENEKVDDNGKRVEYLSGLGWSVETAPLSAQYTTLPEEFPEVLEEYNALQRQQGFDLRPYAGKDVTIYIYKVLSDTMEETLYCTLYTHRGRVIGGDVHTASLNGFMSVLVRDNEKKG